MAHGTSVAIPWILSVVGNGGGDINTVPDGASARHERIAVLALVAILAAAGLVLILADTLTNHPTEEARVAADPSTLLASTLRVVRKVVTPTIRSPWVQQRQWEQGIQPALMDRFDEVIAPEHPGCPSNLSDNLDPCTALVAHARKCHLVEMLSAALCLQVERECPDEEAARVSTDLLVVNRVEQLDTAREIIRCVRALAAGPGMQIVVAQKRVGARASVSDLRALLSSTALLAESETAREFLPILRRRLRNPSGALDTASAEYRLEGIFSTITLERDQIFHRALQKYERAEATNQRRNMDAARVVRQARHEYDRIAKEKSLCAQQYKQHVAKWRSLNATEDRILRGRAVATAARCTEKYDFIMRVVFVCELLAAVIAVVVTLGPDDMTKTEHTSNSSPAADAGSSRSFSYLPEYLEDLYSIIQLGRQLNSMVDSLGSVGRTLLRGIGLSTVATAVLALLSVESVIAPFLVVWGTGLLLFGQRLSLAVYQSRVPARNLGITLVLPFIWGAYLRQHIVGRRDKLCRISKQNPDNEELGQHALVGRYQQYATAGISTLLICASAAFGWCIGLSIN